MEMVRVKSFEAIDDVDMDSKNIQKNAIALNIHVCVYPF